MKKNKISIILAVLTCICIFSVAALVDQCGCKAIPIEEKTDVEIEEKATEEEVTEKAIEDNGEEPESEEEEVPEEVEEKEEESQPAQEEPKEAPIIELQIYEGPLYSQADNICYYRVKAIVTGTPTPDVEFSKDDSGVAWGKYKAQVNLNDPADTYNLTATATNSEGIDTDNIDLSWGCPMPNNPPEIADIVTFSIYLLEGQQYEFEVQASDPDGDVLTFEWSVSDGTIIDPNTNPMTWETLNSGVHEIRVQAFDGKGGIAEKTITVEVLKHQIVEINFILSEGGEIEENEGAYIGNLPYVGDSERNNAVRGFVSFDISSYSGGIVMGYGLYFQDPIKNGEPKEPSDPLIEAIWLEVVDWGSGTIQYSDYYLGGTLIEEEIGPHISVVSMMNIKIGEELQKAFDAGKDRFQLRIRHKGHVSNYNGIWDGWKYQNVQLRFGYAYR